MGRVIGQRWEIYDYDKVKDDVLKRGEMVFVKETPDDFGENIVQLISNGKDRKIKDLYNDWKNGTGSPFRTSADQDVIDAKTLADAKEYADEIAKNEWLKPVNTAEQLQITGLSDKKNYLCKVIADPVKSGIYQAVAGWKDEPVWALYDDTVDLVNEQELAAIIAEHNEDATAHEDIREAINREVSHREEQNRINDNKADKVANSVNDNFAGLNADGNLKDSGKKADDFVFASEKGAVGGIATLGEDGVIPTEQLPSANGILAVAHDDTLKGKGIPDAPLGISFPIIIPEKTETPVKNGTLIASEAQVFDTEKKVANLIQNIKNVGHIAYSLSGDCQTDFLKPLYGGDDWILVTNPPPRTLTYKIPSNKVTGTGVIFDNGIIKKEIIFPPYIINSNAIITVTVVRCRPSTSATIPGGVKLVSSQRGDLGITDSTSLNYTFNSVTLTGKEQLYLEKYGDQVVTNWNASWADVYKTATEYIYVRTTKGWL